MTNQHLTISAPRSSTRDGVSRVSADVDGSEVWFESADVALRPASEAFVSAFLIPAAIHERQLVAAAPVAADFAANVPRVLDTVARWWKYARLLPKLDTNAAHSRQPAVATRQQAGPGTALCFSGGVDSFFSLLAADRTVDALVFVHGFDVKPDDTERAAAVEEHLRSVAHEVGARPIVLRTNLRSHPTFRTCQWIRTYGGALGAIGHLLSDTWGTLLVSSSYSYSDPRPSGSHWELDPLWSGAGLVVDHVGAECSRTDKLAVLKDHPLVQRYLRVCWENRSSSLNCSRCEKCIRNEVVLAGLGALESFQVFDGPPTLAERVDGVECVKNEGLFKRYEISLAMGLPYDVDAAVRRLMARSRRARMRRRLDDTRWYAMAVARRLLRLGRVDRAPTVGEPGAPGRA
ncbi:MAG TPA: hypothetical protein VFK39_09030 [Gemmatimonadaceae bacterium]|nr:hypothetical protein [Gemmatimonadaceae bacterium]